MSLLPAAAAPEGPASWRVIAMTSALLPAMATAAAAAAAASPTPAGVAIWQALPLVATGVAEHEGLLSGAATAGPQRNLLQLMPMMATAAASLRRGNGSRRVAMCLLTTATVTSSALIAATAAARAAAAAAAPAAAAGDARKKAATSSNRPHVNWRLANDGAAAAARAALNRNGPHTTDEDAFSSFPPERIRGAASTFLLQLRAYWTALVFFFLLLLWFAVAAWCPIYMLPLLFVPAYVRRRIAHDVQQAKEVLLRVEMQHQQQRRSRRKQPQAKDAEKEEEDEEWERQQQQQQEQAEMQQRPFGQQQQQRPKMSEEYQSQELRQRRPLHREFPESEDQRETEEREEEKQQILFTGLQQQQQRQQQERQQEPQQERQQERQQQQQLKLRQQQPQRAQTSEKKEEEEPDMKQDVKDATNTWYAARNRGMGFLHAVLASALGLYCLFFDETIRNDRMRGSSVLSIFDALLLTSYFTWDLTAILGHWKEDSPQWLLHCLVSLLALIHPLTATAEEPPMNYYGVALSLFELSTPFLALRYFCIKAAAADPSAPIVGNDPGRGTRMHLADEKPAAAAEAAAAAAAAAAGKEDAAGAASAALPAAAAAPAPAAPEPGAEATAAAAKEGAAAAGAARDMRTGAARAASAAANVEGEGGLPKRPAPVTGTQSPVCEMSSSYSHATDADGDTAAAEAAAADMKRKTGGVGGAASAATATAGRNIKAEAAAAARHTEKSAAEEVNAGKQEEEKATAAAPAEGPPPRTVRIYEAVVSAAFALVFFAVRIVWGNFFLLPEIVSQILSPAAASLLRPKKIFFLCAMPVFAALNLFWMLLIIKLLIKPKK